MAEQYHQQYSYHEMSNKVEQADRSLLRKRANEPTGEVESLRGRSDIGRMGDKIPQAAAPALPKPKKQKKQQETTTIQREPTFVARQTILDVDNVTGYRPTTPMARAAYEALLVRKE